MPHKIDMGEAPDYEPIPAGWYDCVLSDWEWVEESQTSGEPYIKFEFAVDEGEFEGRKLWRNSSVQTKALPYLKKLLLALGADADDVGGEFDADDLIPDLVGNPCRIKVKMREYEGEEQNEIERITAAQVLA